MNLARLLLEDHISRQEQKQMTSVMRNGTNISLEEHKVNREQARELRQLCMFIPNHKHRCNERDARLTIPYNGFIPKKKEQQKPIVHMHRRLWNKYLKLPALRNPSPKELHNSIR